MLVLHGCNCFNTMNSGIAAYLRRIFPVIYDIDCLTKKGDKDKLGTYSRVQVTHQFNILNCYTQYKYGRDKRYADYDAIDRCLDTISHNFAEGVWDIRMPKIGCGLARGDWNVVEQLINENLGSHNVTVFYLEGDKQ